MITPFATAAAAVTISISGPKCKDGQQLPLEPDKPVAGSFYLPERPTEIIATVSTSDGDIKLKKGVTQKRLTAVLLWIALQRPENFDPCSGKFLPAKEKSP